MSISYKGPQYLNIATASAKRASEKKNWWQKSLMDAVDDKVDDANKLGRNFISTISDNFKTQLEYDADYNDAENKHQELANLSGYDISMKEYIMKALIHKTKTFQQLENHIIDGDFIPITNKEVEVASYDAPSPSFYKNLTEKLAEKESTNNWNAKVELTKGSCKGGQALGKWQFTTCHLETFRNNNKKAKFTNDQFLKSPDLQKAVMQWQLKSINKFINKNNLDKYIGRTINGVKVTREGLFAVAHLGGNGGLRQFLKSNGKLEESDQLGTSFTKYLAAFGEGEQVSNKSSLLDMFSTGGMAKKKAIKIAMKNLGLSESEAINMLEGSLLNQASFLGDSKVTIGGKLPDISDVTTIEKWNAMNAQLDQSRLKTQLGETRYDQFKKKFDGLKNSITANNWNKQLNDINSIKNLTLEDALIIKKAAESNGSSLPAIFTEKLAELEQQNTALSKIPEIPKDKDGIDAWVLKTLQAYGVTDRSQLDEVVQKYLTTTINSISGRDLSLTVGDSAEEILFRDLSLNQEFIDGDEETRKKMVLNLTNKIAMAKQADQFSMPTSREEALFILLDNTGKYTQSHIAMAERYLNVTQNTDRDTVTLWTKITDDIIELKYPSLYASGKRAKDYKDFAIPVGANKYITTEDGQEVVKYYVLGSERLGSPDAVEITDWYGEVPEAALSELAKFSQNNNQVLNKYNTKLEATYKFQATANNLVDIVKDQPDVLLPFAASIASGVEGVRLEVNALVGLIEDAFSGGGLSTRQVIDPNTGEMVSEEYLSLEQVEALARDSNVLGEGETFTDVMKVGNLGSISDLASARKRFLAESVLLVFRTGVQEGQTGQGMSNKDFERFATFVKGFRKPEDFEASLKNFMKAQYASLNVDANLINNPAFNPKFEDFKAIGHFIPMRGFVTTFDDYLTKINDTQAMEIRDYFTGDESRFSNASTGGGVDSVTNVFDTEAFNVDGVFSRDEYERKLDAAGIEVGQTFSIRTSDGQLKTYKRSRREGN